MRAWVLGLSLIACGSVESAPDVGAPTGDGGGAQAGVGASNAVAASGAGAAGLAGGVARGAAGGVTGSAATVPSAGNAGSAAASGDGGDGGGGGGGATSDAAGASAVGNPNTYDACGCGCCGAPLNNRCYYPALGEDLSEIIAQDRAAADNASCASEGCAAGTHYVRCETAAVEAGSAYTLSGFSDNVQHLQISRQSQTGRCTRVLFQVHLPQPGLVLQLPTPGPGPDHASDGSCSTADGTWSSAPIGALGSVTQPDQSGCVFDFDYTLFFLADSGAADAVRFKAEGIELAGCK